jgi:uncharacterized protein YegP (UPF0339 family)
MALTALYTFNGQSINLNRISRVGAIITTKSDGKEVYYFTLVLSGTIIKSQLYTSQSDATSARNLIINEF